MSRYNNPSRGFFSSIDESQYHYIGQIPQVRISPVEQTQQWNSLPRSQSVQGTREQTYSPTGSAITTRTTPNTRMVDRSFYSPSNLFQNTYLNPVLPGGSSMLTSDDIRGLNQSAGAEAWSSWNMRSAEDRGARNPPRQSNVDFQPYSRIGSDVHKGALPSDEGYYSVQTSQSVLGNEPERSSQDLTIDFMSPMGNMNVASVVSEATVSHIPPDQKSRVSSTRSRKSGHKPTICEYPECKEIFRCPSEYKKHLLKHEKPFTCDEPNCKRAAKGFATKNDLIRHKKSVHNSLDLDNKSYRCAGKNCKTKDKIWPRFDNFKQHVLRMHRDEDVTDVIERSRWHTEKQACVPTDDITMETDLILSGMDKSFPANMHNLSPLDFSLQQDSQNWNLPDWRADSTKEGHQVPETLTEHSPTKQTDGFKKPRPVQRQELGLSAQQTQTSLSDIATNATPKENVSQASQSKMSHGLSNAPQTKAEQQRLAQKRSVSVPSPTNPVDLENLIRNIIQKVNGAERQDGKSTEKAPVGSETLSDSDKMGLTKRSMLEASQEILKLINQNSESVQGAARRPGRRRVCPMVGCNVTVNRVCELRKHMKRHEKPYGCTYPVCNKRFGAKSDWKRHENSQHYQLEAFRCAHEVSPGTVCGKHEHREAAFITHAKEHGLSQENSRDLIERSKIGTNCQGSFWCGFCKAVIKLKEERHKAWDERFRHIAIHFEQEKKRIDDWVCAEKDKTKRELLEEKEKEEFNEDYEREEEREFGSPTEEDSDNSPPPAPPPPPPQGHEHWKFRPMETGVPQAQPMQYPSFGPSNIRKRAAATELDTVYETERQKRRRPEVFKYCCSCGSGPSSSLQPACIGCQHEFCGNCDEDIMYDRVD